jgi:hypothetical protein
MPVKGAETRRGSQSEWCSPWLLDNGSRVQSSQETIALETTYSLAVRNYSSRENFKGMKFARVIGSGETAASDQVEDNTLDSSDQRIFSLLVVTANPRLNPTLLDHITNNKNATSRAGIAPLAFASLDGFSQLSPPHEGIQACGFLA